MDIKVKYKKVFSDLYKSVNGLLAYTLYSRYSLMPSEAIDFINTYQNEEYISIDEEQRIKLTEKGKNSIVNLQKELNYVAKNSTNKFVSELVLIESNLEVFQPYIPNKDFYDKYLKERRNRN